MAARLNHVGRVLAVMSGKGGVGKSLVAGLLAVALRREGHTVGILDASSHSRAALEAAAQLAARFEAELLGLFVEDENLLRLAELPFVHELGTFSATRRRLEAQQMERELRVMARRLQETFAAVVARANLHGSFRVVRGAVAAELLAAAMEADILILSRTGQAPSQRRRLGSTARAAIAEGQCLTMLLGCGTCLAAPVAVVYDGSEAAQRALAVAAVLREDEDTPLSVFILAAGLRQAERLRQQADGWLRERGAQAHYRLLTEANVPALTRALRTEPCGTLIIPAEIDVLETGAVLQLLDEITMPALLVR